jgi:hypothetical protein
MLPDFQGQNSKAQSDLVYRGNSPPDLRKQSIEAETHTHRQNNTRNTLSRQANLKKKILKEKYTEFSYENKA